MVVDWPVKFHPRWQRAAKVLTLPVLPFYALREFCHLFYPPGQRFPPWLQLLLVVPGVIFLALPTWLYAQLGIVEVLDLEGEADEPLPAASGE
jgi:hypothetical protein